MWRRVLALWCVACTAQPEEGPPPLETKKFVQAVDHFSVQKKTWKQRYWEDTASFGGPGSPIFLILGGQSAIAEDSGMLYPFVTNVLAVTHKAAVLLIEHRYYGKSIPVEVPPPPHKAQTKFLTTRQVLADAAALIEAKQLELQCKPRGHSSYCPVLTIGASYPGYLSAMMRLRYPSLVDMAYASSAPMKFYSQQVDRYAFFNKVTESAEKTVMGCAYAGRVALDKVESYYHRPNGRSNLIRKFKICPWSTLRVDLLDDILTLVAQTFTNLNLRNYPPGNHSDMWMACTNITQTLFFSQDFTDTTTTTTTMTSQTGTTGTLSSTETTTATPTTTSTLNPAIHFSAVDAIANLLLNASTEETFRFPFAKFNIGRSAPAWRPAQCLDINRFKTDDAQSSLRCADWTGCGAGQDGYMWDYQSCTYEVQQISLGGERQMFPKKELTPEWLKTYCMMRFGVEPLPWANVERWGFDEANLRAQSSRILFTNGLMDAYSVAGYLENISVSKQIISINMPNGAHHSEMQMPFPGEELPIDEAFPGELTDTPDVLEAQWQIVALIGQWIHQVKLEDPGIPYGQPPLPEYPPPVSPPLDPIPVNRNPGAPTGPEPPAPPAPPDPPEMPEMPEPGGDKLEKPVKPEQKPAEKLPEKLPEKPAEKLPEEPAAEEPAAEEPAAEEPAAEEPPPEELPFNNGWETWRPSPRRLRAGTIATD